MGLYASHGCWSGAYGAFTRWRNELAEVAGYWIHQMPNGHTTAVIDWGHVTAEQLHGEWAETPADPLLVLIAHSDCEGVIHPAQAGPLADRLEELIPLLPLDRAGGHVGDWRETTQQFADGLRRAAAAGEDVEFA